MKQLTILKIGGKIIDNQVTLESTLEHFCTLDSPKILIHGGGTLATELAPKLGIETKMVDGRRITDSESLKLVTMVYAGLINKQIVALLQKYGCNAIGLCGADGNIIPALKRKSSPINFGYVGDIIPESINSTTIASLIARGLTPVICPITHDQNGQLLNTNADTVASSVAIAMARDFDTKLIFNFDKKGVLSDSNDPNSVIPLITSNSFDKLKEEGIIKDGMLPKVQNALNAVIRGVREVYINETLVKL